MGVLETEKESAIIRSREDYLNVDSLAKKEKNGRK